MEGAAPGKYRFHARIVPKPTSDTQLYQWTPEPLSGQGTPLATFDLAGVRNQAVNVRVQLLSGAALTATQSITVPSRPIGVLSQGSLSVQPDASVQRYEPVTATLWLTPTGASYDSIIWSPTPRQGQGKAEALFAWGTAGEKILSAVVSQDSIAVQVITQTVTVAPTSAVTERFNYLPIAKGENTLSAADAQIIGGEEADPNDWPWKSVLIADPDDPATYFCGGTLIAAEWVLTAAHCVDQWQFGTLFVVVGRHRLSTDAGEALPVDEIWIHPNYNDYTADADIALLKLGTASTSTPLPVHVEDFATGEMATVIGWGQTNPYDSGSDSDVLMQVAVPIVSDESCFASYGGSITANMLCAGRQGTDSCFGDSGGPLMVPSEQGSGWSQVGIVSWGYGCGQLGYPGVYTRLANFADWIATHVEDETVPTPDAYEKDDALGQASEIMSDGSVQSHNFHVEGDVDWVWFDATASYTYTIETNNLSEGNGTTLRLYDNHRFEVARDENSSEGNGSRLVWVAAQSGRHYARVAADGTPSGSNPSYDLTVIEAQPVVTIDDYEEDDDILSANPIEVDGAAQMHTFHVAGDEDWVKFEAEAGVIYRIETMNLTERADTLLSLYRNEYSHPILSDDDSGDGVASSLEWMADESETFYIRAHNYDQEVAGNRVRYELRVGRVLDPGGSEPYEYNNTRQEATPIEPDNIAQTHTFYVGSEPDWFRFEVNSGELYALETHTSQEGGDTALSLVSDGIPSAFTDDSGDEFNARLIWRAGRDGELHAVVRQVFPTASGPETQYDVTLARGEDIAYPYEPDDTRQTAKAIEINGLPQVRDFHRPGDVDWLVFQATAGTSYRFETFGLSVNSDTVLRLHDADGREIMLDDDGNGGRASRIDWTAAESGTYFLSVHNYASSVGGPFVQYQIRATTVE